MKTKSLTTAQALITFLKNQSVECDGNASPFFAGVWGIFGHGNLAGIGQALQQTPDFRFYLARNEQAMVGTATAYAKMKNRLSTFACTSSVGPGETNMITGAATATINRLPVLLLPGDIFARRNVAPVLQQLESSHTQDISVNDAFKPVSRYWDRINRPDQLPSSLMEAMRVLTSPAHTGAVTLALPQDVQAEAWNYPAKLFEKRVWPIPRALADRALLARALEWIRAAQKPFIIAGGGVIYSEAGEALARLVEQTGIPVGETMAGKGALPWNHPQNLEALGATGTPGAHILAREADLVIAVGTRLSDFTTASRTAFQNPNVHFIAINVNEFDAHKHAALPLIADARATLEELSALVAGYHVGDEYRARVARFRDEWDAEVDRIYHLEHGPLVSQGEVIGAVNEIAGPRDVVLCASGSLPGDLHKLWRARDTKSYHLEYGYSTMGYEIAGGLGVKMAAPDREVYVMVGDGSYLMMNSEIVTAIQERIKLIIVLLDNSGFKSIGSLSRSLGQDGFGTRYVYPRQGQWPTDAAGDDVQTLPVDLAANARSLGAHVIECETYADFVAALETVQTIDRTSVIYIRNDRYQAIASYEGWWDVPIAEVSTMPSVQEARAEWVTMQTQERDFLE